MFSLNKTKFETKFFFHKNEYDKWYPSGCAPVCIYGTPKMVKFPSSELFPKARAIV